MCKEYSILGPFARADVRWTADGAVLTGHLGGELVGRTFTASDSDAYVFEVARALAFLGKWPREVEPRSGDTWQALPAVMERRAHV